MKHFKFILPFFILLGVFVTSCVKEKNFSSIPLITFEKFVLYKNDSANCYIKFKDGDGDIGIYSGDTISQDDLKMKYLYKGLDGKFYPVDAILGNSQFDTLFYSYRVPNITPDGQYKALDGEIEIKLRTAPVFDPSHTIVKFEIVLTDRSGHKSNMVSTDEITVTP